MIPLLMEKMSWPPAGSMGPIFGEYLFIRFFARPNEAKSNDQYWPDAKFEELLQQMRVSYAPDLNITSGKINLCKYFARFFVFQRLRIQIHDLMQSFTRSGGKIRVKIYCLLWRRYQRLPTTKKTLFLLLPRNLQKNPQKLLSFQNLQQIRTTCKRKR